MSVGMRIVKIRGGGRLRRLVYVCQECGKSIESDFHLDRIEEFDLAMRVAFDAGWRIDREPVLCDGCRSLTEGGGL